jgi:hypothetical protein
MIRKRKKVKGSRPFVQGLDSFLYIRNRNRICNQKKETYATMALPPENLDGGRRAIVIGDVPAGTGIADLVGAFSPFGAIQFAYMGPPAVVGFEKESAAIQALLVSSMKSVSLLGGSKEKKAASPESPMIEASATASPSEPAAPETKITQIETAAAAAAPTEAAAPETKISPGKDATVPPPVIVDRETIESIQASIAALEKNALVVDQETIDTLMNSMVALERHVDTMKQLLIEECNEEYYEEEFVNDDLDHDKAWSDGYNLGYWGNSNHYDAWLAGYQAGDKDSRWKEGDVPIHGDPMLAN